VGSRPAGGNRRLQRRLHPRRQPRLHGDHRDLSVLHSRRCGVQLHRRRGRTRGERQRCALRPAADGRQRDRAGRPQRRRGAHRLGAVARRARRPVDRVQPRRDDPRHPAPGLRHPGNARVLEVSPVVGRHHLRRGDPAHAQPARAGRHRRRAGSDRRLFPPAQQRDRGTAAVAHRPGCRSVRLALPPVLHADAQGLPRAALSQVARRAGDGAVVARGHRRAAARDPQLLQLRPDLRQPCRDHDRAFLFLPRRTRDGDRGRAQRRARRDAGRGREPPRPGRRRAARSRDSIEAQKAEYEGIE
jgi:hypothetical protein